ncbi:MAG: hypothetical protein ACYTG5_12775 [Planctomycetota bacterium]
MAETLGSLCDKLTIVKLKQWHAEENSKRDSLAEQESRLRSELDDFVNDAASGVIPRERLTFAANKVLKGEASRVPNAEGSIGEVFAELARVNCELWHEQEKVYEFEAVPNEERVPVVKKLGVLNIERTKCIDAIDVRFLDLLSREEQVV